MMDNSGRLERGGGRLVRFGVLGGLCAVAVSGLSLWILGWLVVTSHVDSQKRRAAGEVSRAFRDNLEFGDLDKAFALTSERFQREVNFEAFGKLIEAHPALKG